MVLVQGVIFHLGHVTDVVHYTRFLPGSSVDCRWAIAILTLSDDNGKSTQWAGELAAVLMNRFHQEQISAVIRDELVIFTKE